MRTSRGPIGLPYNRNTQWARNILASSVKLGLVLGIFLGQGGNWGHWPRWTGLSLCVLPHHGHSLASPTEEIQSLPHGPQQLVSCQFMVTSFCRNKLPPGGAWEGNEEAGGTTRALACRFRAGGFLFGSTTCTWMWAYEVWVLGGRGA